MTIHCSLASRILSLVRCIVQSIALQIQIVESIRDEKWYRQQVSSSVEYSLGKEGESGGCTGCNRLETEEISAIFCSFVLHSTHPPIQSLFNSGTTSHVWSLQCNFLKVMVFRTAVVPPTPSLPSLALPVPPPCCCCNIFLFERMIFVK